MVQDQKEQIRALKPGSKVCGGRGANYEACGHELRGLGTQGLRRGLPLTCAAFLPPPLPFSCTSAPLSPGIHITAVDPTGSCAGAVQPGDVLVSVAGRAVAADGTAELRPGQRVLFGHFVNTGSIGQALALEVVRAGQRLQLSIR